MSSPEQSPNEPATAEPVASEPQPAAPIDYATWRRRVEAELGETSYRDALVHRGRDGLDLQPLYRAESLPPGFDAAALPGQAPFTRGRRPTDGTWRIAQEVAQPRASEAAAEMRDDQRDGVDLLWLRFARFDSGARRESPEGGIRLSTPEQAEELVDAVEPATALVLDQGADTVAAALWIAAWRRRGRSLEQLRGNFACDPLADLARDGSLSGSLEVAFRQLAELVGWTLEQAPGMRSVLVSTTPYHDAGATAVQELAFALAGGTEVLRRMTGPGIELEAAASQIDFAFSIGRDFFREIAKLRAARLLWSKVTAACGAGEAARAARIHARASSREMSRYDPWMNLLRGGTQTFAAALGGADSILTAPYDQALGRPERTSRRLAANVQHILAEEARLARVVDAAGGSWFLESLTDDLARAAWQLFQRLESRGGMARCLLDGEIARLVAPAAEALREEVADRRQAIIGTTAFANLAETPFEPGSATPNTSPEPSETAASREPGSDPGTPRGSSRAAAALEAFDRAVTEASVLGDRMSASISALEDGAPPEELLARLAAGRPATCPKLESARLARPFERLRQAGDRWLREQGSRARAAIVAIDDNARTDAMVAFVRRLVAVAGIEGVVTAPETITEEAWVAVILCGDRCHDPDSVAELAAGWAESGVRHLLVAGDGPPERQRELRDAGVDGFLYDGCDVYRVLRDLVSQLGSP